MKLLTTQSTTEELLQAFEPEEFTTDITEAIFMIDNNLIDGGFDCGIRGIDHNTLKSLFDPSTTWEALHDTYNIIRLVPESMTALISTNQTITGTQRDQLEQQGYTIEAY